MTEEDYMKPISSKLAVVEPEEEEGNFYCMTNLW